MNRSVKLLIGSAVGLTLVLLALPQRPPATTPVPVVPVLPIATPPVAQKPIARPATRQQLAAQTARSASLAWKRDPFAPPLVPEEPVVEIAPPEEPQIETRPTAVDPPAPILPIVKPRLSGISTRGQQSWAIIDGQVVQEGDILSARYRVGKISSRSVTVLTDEEELTLNLGDRQ